MNPGSAGASNRRLHGEIHPVHPTGLDAWLRCRRRYLLGWVLRLPAVDDGPAAERGRRLHDLLRFLHERGRIDDPAHVDEVLAAHGADASMRPLVDRHLGRCPSGATGHHEVSIARFHRHPPPLFMATARFDVLWEHGDLLDARDYKTGGRWLERVADDPRARVQAWVLAPHARRRGLRLQLRYEHLALEVADDPEPWEPDDEELHDIEATLGATVAAMRHEVEWAGTDDAAACARCGWRELCDVRPRVATENPG